MASKCLFNLLGKSQWNQAWLISFLDVLVFSNPIGFGVSKHSQGLWTRICFNRKDMEHVELSLFSTDSIYFLPLLSQLSTTRQCLAIGPQTAQSGAPFSKWWKTDNRSEGRASSEHAEFQLAGGSVSSPASIVIFGTQCLKVTTQTNELKERTASIWYNK